MIDDSGFDLEEMLLVLNPFIDGQAEGSKEKDALKLAQIALLYVRENKEEADFGKYYKLCTDTEFTVEVSCEFATREEADTWLASGRAKDSDRVKIAGKGFMVVRLPGRLALAISPLPEELNSPEWQDDSE